MLNAQHRFEYVREAQSMFKFFSRRSQQASANTAIDGPETLRDVNRLFETLDLDAARYQKFEPRPLPDPAKIQPTPDALALPLVEEECPPPSGAGAADHTVIQQEHRAAGVDDVTHGQTDDPVVLPVQESRFKWVTRLENDMTRIASKDALVVGFASYSGGVGKSTLCAALSGALHAQHHHCLVLGQTPFSPLPFYLGAQNPLDANSDDAFSRHVLTLPEAPGSLNLVIANRAGLDVVSEARSSVPHADLIFYDLEASSEIASAFELMDLLLVPLRPDVNGLIIINRIEQAVASLSSSPKLGVYYIVNQYDASKSVHREVRAALKKRIGERLIDISVPMDDSVQEALASGALPETYRPDAPFVAAIHELSAWLKEITRLPKRS